MDKMFVAHDAIASPGITARPGGTFVLPRFDPPCHCRLVSCYAQSRIKCMAPASLRASVTNCVFTRLLDAPQYQFARR